MARFEHLNRKLTSLVGQTFVDFNNPYAGFGLNYGDFDGITGSSARRSTR